MICPNGTKTRSKPDQIIDLKWRTSPSNSTEGFYLPLQNNWRTTFKAQMVKMSKEGDKNQKQTRSRSTPRATSRSRPSGGIFLRDPFNLTKLKNECFHCKALPWKRGLDQHLLQNNNKDFLVEVSLFSLHVSLRNLFPLGAGKVEEPRRSWRRLDLVLVWPRYLWRDLKVGSGSSSGLTQILAGGLGGLSLSCFMWFSLCCCCAGRLFAAEQMWISFTCKFPQTAPLFLESLNAESALAHVYLSSCGGRDGAPVGAVSQRRRAGRHRLLAIRTERRGGAAFLRWRRQAASPAHPHSCLFTRQPPSRFLQEVKGQGGPPWAGMWCQTWPPCVSWWHTLGFPQLNRLRPCSHGNNFKTQIFCSLLRWSETLKNATFWETHKHLET